MRRNASVAGPDGSLLQGRGELGRVSRREALGVLVALAGVSTAAWPQPAAPAGAPPELAAPLPGARLLGRGRLTYFGLRIYDARLWTTEGFTAENYAQQTFALELEYARSLEGKQIAERSLTEMKRVGGISEPQGQRWLAEMTQAFPDVAQGDRLTGVHRPGEAARFFLNGKARADVGDAEFARRFFGIWLSPQTSEPKLRAALLDLPAS